MKKTRGFLLAAGIMLAMAFTFSCSGDDGDGNGGNTSSSSVGGGGDGGSSSSVGSGSNCSANFKTTKIGTQIWMAENLNCDVEGSKCYEDKLANCEIYGRLYDWETAKTVCPKDWHLPSDAEWTILVDHVGSEAGTKLKKESGWNSNGNGTDEFGFSALPGGHRRSDGSFFNVGNDGNWWSASEGNSSGAYCRRMNYNYSYVYRDNCVKSYLLSVRCLQD